VRPRSGIATAALDPGLWNVTFDHAVPSNRHVSLASVFAAPM
jgi:hypothetical protein